MKTVLLTDYRQLSVLIAVALFPLWQASTAQVTAQIHFTHAPTKQVESVGARRSPDLI